LQLSLRNSAEGGLNGHLSHFLWAVSAYDTRIGNLIDYDPVTFGAANIDAARIRAASGLISTGCLAHSASVTRPHSATTSRAAAPT